jgi:hypothetical protein
MADGQTLFVVVLKFISRQPRPIRYAARGLLLDARQVSKDSAGPAEEVLGDLIREAEALYDGCELHVSLTPLPRATRLGGRPVRVFRLEWASSAKVVCRQAQTNLLHGVSRYGAIGTTLYPLEQ